MRVVSARVVPVHVGSSGTVLLRLKSSLKHMGVDKAIGLIQISGLA